MVALFRRYAGNPGLPATGLLRVPVLRAGVLGCGGGLGGFEAFCGVGEGLRPCSAGMWGVLGSAVALTVESISISSSRAAKRLELMFGRGGFSAVFLRSAGPRTGDHSPVSRVELGVLSVAGAGGICVRIAVAMGGNGEAGRVRRLTEALMACCSFFFPRGMGWGTSAVAVGRKTVEAGLAGVWRSAVVLVLAGTMGLLLAMLMVLRAAVGGCVLSFSAGFGVSEAGVIVVPMGWWPSRASSVCWLFATTLSACCVCCAWFVTGALDDGVVLLAGPEGGILRFCSGRCGDSGNAVWAVVLWAGFAWVLVELWVVSEMFSPLGDGGGVLRISSSVSAAVFGVDPTGWDGWAEVCA